MLTEDTELGKADSPSRGRAVHLERSGKAGGRSEQKSYKIQQRHTHSPAPGKKEPCATIQVESCSAKKDVGLNMNPQHALAAKAASSTWV